MKAKIVVLFATALAINTLIGCGGAEADIIDYRMADEQILDGAKAQIAQRVVVSPPVTENELRALLSYLHNKASERRGFKHFKHPTHIFIWIYTSAEQAKLQGQWIAMSSKVADQNAPSIEVNSQQMALQHKPSAVVFGKTEQELRNIWDEIVQAERRADHVAQQKFPDLPISNGREQFLARIQKQGDNADSLLSGYNRELALKYELSAQQLDSIGTMGIVRQWPLPSR